MIPNALQLPVTILINSEGSIRSENKNGTKTHSLVIRKILLFSHCNHAYFTQ